MARSNAQMDVITITFRDHIPKDTLPRLLGSMLRQSTSFRSIRVVVQHTKRPEGWSYRLIAYEDSCTYRPVDFAEIGALVQAMRRVAPDFSESSLEFREDADHSYLAYGADWQLDDGQLSILGLDPHSSSRISNTLDVGLAHDVRALCGLDFDTSPVPMWIHDRKTLAFVAVNSATVAFYGFTRKELLQMTILDIRPPEDIPWIVQDVLYPHFHDPDGDLRRHRTKTGKVIHVGIKAYKLKFNDRDAEVVVVEVAPSRDGRSVGNSSKHSI